jgi:hypothetical protein
MEILLQSFPSSGGITHGLVNLLSFSGIYAGEYDYLGFLRPEQRG